LTGGIQRSTEPEQSAFRRLFPRRGRVEDDPTLPIPPELTLNLINSEAQPSKKRLDVSVIIAALITAAGAVGTGAFTYYKHDQIDCVSARISVIKSTKEDPEAAIPYTGEYERQCQLTEVMNKVLDATKSKVK
jgi:hypothetical protein